MEIVYLVMTLALIEYMVLGGLVGRARGKYGINAPAVTGNDIFERTFRVHQNTLEGLVIFLPGLWLCGTYWNPWVAAGIGVAGIIGRAIYARAYIRDPASRGPGAAIVGFANVFLVIGGLVGLIRNLL